MLGEEGAMSPSELQLWALVVGLLIFGSVVVVLFLRRRAAERAAGGPLTISDGLSLHPTSVEPAPTAATPPAPTPSDSRAGRRRREPPPPPGAPGELASAIRSLILRAIAERAPAGWSALVLCPPPHPELITWHIHLAAEVALDLQDGRSVAVAAPLASHEWQLSGGRVVGIGEGEPHPPPTDETVRLRVTGPYLVVAVRQANDRPPELSAKVMTADGDELPETRAVATDTRAAQSALRDAVEHAVGSRMLGTPPAVGYRRSSWAGHEKVWLSIAG
jgi:hypothetical protein